MTTLLLQSCSASKQEVNGPTPAFDVYTGYFYKILKKSIRENNFRDDVEIAILSAKYGLIDTSDEIEYYDQRIDDDRAQELNTTVVDTVTERVRGSEFDRVVINMGAPYRKALSGLSEQIDAVLAEVPGDGIGEKGNALHRFIRGDESAVRKVDSL